MSLFRIVTNSVFTFLILCTATAHAKLPNITILATGGTIAGTSSAPANPNAYDPGQLMIEAVLKSIPDLGKVANVTGEQLRDPEIVDLQKSYINIGSFLISERHRILLARRIQEILKDPKTDGIIVTHGTDTIEETAFFLSLTVSSNKPVVLVGAVRPANFVNPKDGSQKPDGPQNVLDAARVIADRGSKGKGVLVVVGGRIHSAFDVTKSRMVKPTENVPIATPFTSQNFGLFGELAEGVVRWSADAKLVKHISQMQKFDVSRIDSLPVVPILYGSAGTPLFMIEAIKKQRDVKAVVLVGTGEGSIDQRLLDFLHESQCLDTKNVIIPGCKPEAIQFVRSSRAQAGYLRENYFFTRTVGSGTLTPTKAQILTQLLLAPVQSAITYDAFRAAFVPYLVDGMK